MNRWIDCVFTNFKWYRKRNIQMSNKSLCLSHNFRWKHRKPFLSRCEFSKYSFLCFKMQFAEDLLFRTSKNLLVCFWFWAYFHLSMVLFPVGKNAKRLSQLLCIRKFDCKWKGGETVYIMQIGFKIRFIHMEYLSRENFPIPAPYRFDSHSYCGIWRP